VTLLRRIGLAAGPLAGIAVYLALSGSELPHAGRATAAAGALMAVWWLTEALEIAVTALVPLVLFPVLGIAPLDRAAAPYADKLIFLFMGGLMVGVAMQRWDLHRRLALLVIRRVGANPAGLVGGFMLAAGLLSMWVSNTATAVMMLPIAMSVSQLVAPPESKGRAANFAPCLLLGVAYATSIGGIATLIGTPPNALLAAFLERETGAAISFVDWMRLALPIVLLFGPLAWFTLAFIAFPVHGVDLSASHDVIDGELRRVGSWSRAEKRVLAVFAAMGAGWLLRPNLAERTGIAIEDAGIAMAGAVALFLIPARKGEALMNWQWAKRLNWDVLILFGGGLSLASAISDNGLAEWLGAHLTAAHALGGFGLLLVVLAVVVFFGELASNTAMVAAFLPILAATAAGAGLEPRALLIPATIAASLGFVLPVGTPPNALVFASGRVTIRQMARAGVLLDLLGILVVAGWFYLFEA
jgi:sodium-dependent dicarboxylate transporter 2/3/5